MSYSRVTSGSFTYLRQVEETEAEHVIKAVEAFIRSHGKSHRELAELAKVDAAEFTMFLQRKFPGAWRDITVRTDETLAKLYSRIERDAAMPVMTPIITETLGMVRVLMADGGIGLLQGDSGTGKTEAVRAVSLKYESAIVVQASTARARPKPMLEDIGRRMSVSYYCRDTGDTYKMVRERLPCFDLLVIDEVHKYIGTPASLHILTDLLKETGVPQLWTATGDLRRYLDRRVGHWQDPFAQIRSRITHKIDLAEVGGSVINADNVRELAHRKFGLKLDAAAARELCGLAGLDNEGSLRLVENTLKHAKRLATAGKLDTIDARLIRASMDRSLSKRTRERARQVVAEPTSAVATPAERQEAKRATA